MDLAERLKEAARVLMGNDPQAPPVLQEDETDETALRWPLDATKIAEQVEREVKEGRDAKAYLERQWALNIAYYSGQQWKDWSRTFGNTSLRLEEKRVPPWRVRMVYNLLRPNTNRLIGKSLKSDPTLWVAPETGADEDVNASALSEKALQILWELLEVPDLLEYAHLWKYCTGNAFLKVYWDHDLGDPVDDESTGKIHWTGDLVVDLVTPFEVVADPMGTRLSKAKWVTHQTWMPVEEVRSTYGRRAKDVQPAKGLDFGEFYITKILSFYNTPGWRPEKLFNDLKLVSVSEKWVRPSPDNPRGLRITVAGGKLVDYRTWDVDGKGRPQRLPFFHFLDVLVPGRLWGASRFEDALAPQTEFNETRSHLIENKRMTSRPKWLIPKGSQVKEDQCTTEPGERVPYVPVGGHKPEPLPAPQVPEYVMRTLEMDLRDVDYAFGGSEISRGSTPPNVGSALAISYLQEQNETSLGPTIKRDERGYAYVGGLILWHVQQKYTAPRTLKFVDEKRKIYLLQDFQGADMRGNIDVRCEAGSSMPRSKVALQQFLLQLWQNKIVQDAGQVRRLLQFPELSMILEDDELDEDVAKAENQDLLLGKTVYVGEWENHQSHMRIHNRVRRQATFKQITPDIIQAFSQHIADHKNASMAVQAQMAQGVPPAGQFGMPGGLPGGDGLPSPQPAFTGGGPEQLLQQSGGGSAEDSEAARTMLAEGEGANAVQE